MEFAASAWLTDLGSSAARATRLDRAWIQHAPGRRKRIRTPSRWSQNLRKGLESWLRRMGQPRARFKKSPEFLCCIKCKWHARDWSAPNSFGHYSHRAFHGL